MNNTGEKIMNIINEISELEILKAEILYSKFQNTLKKEYEEKIKLVENDFLSKAKVYGKNPDEIINEKNNIIKKYDAEFQKIYDSRREQFINIQNEIQEMVANKMIVIANFNQVAKNKETYMDSEVYQEFVMKKNKFKNIIDTTLKSDEFNKYTKLLNELRDPLEVYQKKYIALATKFNSYDEAIKECEQKLYDCIEVSQQDFKAIVSHIDMSLVTVKKSNIFYNIINKIINKLSNGSKFQKDVIQKIEKDILSIQQENQTNIELIENQTIGLIATIEQVRENINNEFKVAIG